MDNENQGDVSQFVQQICLNGLTGAVAAESGNEVIFEYEHDLVVAAYHVVGGQQLGEPAVCSAAQLEAVDTMPEADYLASLDALASAVTQAWRQFRGNGRFEHGYFCPHDSATYIDLDTGQQKSQWR